MKTLTEIGYEWIDKGIIPDFVIRFVIRSLLRQRLREIDHGSLNANHEAKMKWIEGVKARETIAEKTGKANEQHYEVSTKFILSCLGPYAKYSSCIYPTGKETLAEAEVLILESYCTKAQLSDGMDVLDLGCGWGSLSLYLAQKFPNSRIVGLSNSQTQREHILARAKERGYKNLEIITADVNTFDFDSRKYVNNSFPTPAMLELREYRFDRILSIEMFEHMKNYSSLLHKVSTWLRPNSQKSPQVTTNTGDSLLFVHIFCHKTTPYHFEDDDGWMAQMFFSGGTMPSHDLFLYFQSDLTLLRSWYIPGTHYARTLEDWLKLQDKNAKEGLEELEDDAERHGKAREEGRKVFYRFRVFYMACAELFAFNGGEEWGVGHYLFKRKDE